MERRRHLSPRNPYFKHASYCSWIAYLGDRPAGRISAQVDRLHTGRYQDATGFFGMLEAEDNPEIFRALTRTAEEWLRAKGMQRITGPFNLSINQECGLLIEGFDTPPSIMMGHAPEYYAPRIEEQGYQKEKDLLAYLVPIDFEWPSHVTRLIAKTTEDVHVRPLRKASFLEDLDILREIFNDAWSENWGFIPFTKSEFRELGQAIGHLISEEFVQIAEVNGTPAAMIVALPNINEIIADLNGRLFPTGWIKFLLRLRAGRIESARVPLMGVCRRYQDTLSGPALAFMVIDAVRSAAAEKGIRKVEMSWILEDNTGIRNIIESIGGSVYKRYRIYGKILG